MATSHKPDPYDGFKCDRERRKALGTRVRWSSVAYVLAAGAMFGNPQHAKEAFEWISKLFR